MAMPLTEQQEKDFLAIKCGHDVRCNVYLDDEGDQCLADYQVCTCDFVPALSRLRAAIGALQSEVEALRKFKASVDDALNSGDGAYRP